MKAYSYEAMTYDGAVYCTDCLPDGVTKESEEAYPIFADSEWDCYPVCDRCHSEHEYVNLTEYGQWRHRFRSEPETIRKLREQNNGKLPASALPGGYPLLYVRKDGSVVCPACANLDVDGESQAVVAYDVHWEGPPEECADCGAAVESAYGDPTEQ
jgi:hypothetical protein